MPRTRAIDLYLKPGVEEDDRIHSIWFALRSCGRPQEVLRRALMLGLRAMAQSGELPHTVGVLVAGLEGAAAPVSARGLFAARPAPPPIPASPGPMSAAAIKSPKATPAAAKPVVQQAGRTEPQSVTLEPKPVPSAVAEETQLQGLPVWAGGAPGTTFVDKDTRSTLGPEAAVRYAGEAPVAAAVTPRPAPGPRRLGRIM